MPSGQSLWPTIGLCTNFWDYLLCFRHSQFIVLSCCKWSSGGNARDFLMNEGSWTPTDAVGARAMSLQSRSQNSAGTEIPTEISVCTLCLGYISSGSPRKWGLAKSEETCPSCAKHSVEVALAANISTFSIFPLHFFY